MLVHRYISSWLLYNAVIVSIHCGASPNRVISIWLFSVLCTCQFHAPLPGGGNTGDLTNRVKFPTTGQNWLSNPHYVPTPIVGDLTTPQG